MGSAQLTRKLYLSIQFALFFFQAELVSRSIFVHLLLEKTLLAYSSEKITPKACKIYNA